MILFKMKVWLDLNERKSNGDKIDNKNINKDKNDILRLAANIESDSFVEVAGKVRTDVLQFLKAVETEKVNVINLGIRNSSFAELLERMKICYRL